MIRSILLELLNNKVNSKLFPCLFTIYIDTSQSDSVYLTNILTEKRLKVDICIIRQMFGKKEDNLLNDVPVKKNASLQQHPREQNFLVYEMEKVTLNVSPSKFYLRSILIRNK